MIWISIPPFASKSYFYIVIIYITSISIAGFNVMSIITSRKILNKKQYGQFVGKNANSITLHALHDYENILKLHLLLESM